MIRPVHPILLFLAPLLLVLHSTTVAADLNPVRQPTAVVHAARAAAFQALMDTHQGRAFGASQLDRSKRLPGLGTGPTSWRGFIDSLMVDGARDFWYCLLPGAGFLDGAKAGLGWQWPAPVSADETTAWLESLGFKTGKLAHDAGSGGRVRMASDQRTLGDLTGGAPDNRAAWQDDLVGFLGRGRDGVGVWFGTRPIFGALSLFTGFDARMWAGRVNLKAPEVASLDLAANDGDLGFTLRLSQVFPTASVTGDDSRLALRYDSPAALELVIASPKSLLAALNLDRNFLYPVNMEMADLIPSVALVQVWQDEAGEVRWRGAGYLPDADRFRRQWRRLNAWLDFIGDGGDLPVVAGGVQDDGSRSLTVDGFPVHLGLAPAAKGGSWLLAGGSRDDLPDVGMLSFEENCEPRLLSWRFAPDETERTHLAELWTELARRAGQPDVHTLRSAIPLEEDGQIRAENTDVVIDSPKGMALWFAPMVAEFAERLRRPDSGK